MNNLEFSAQNLPMLLDRRPLIRSLILFFMVGLCPMLPPTLYIPNTYVWKFIVIALAFCLVALFLNHKKYILAAGVLMVLVCEGGIIAVIVTTQPFQLFNLPLFDLFAMTVVIAVSLLPPGFAWYVLGFNLIFLIVFLKIGNLSYDLQHDVSNFSLLLIILVRPIGSQFVVTGITFLWVRGTNRLTSAIHKEMTRQRLLISQLTRNQKEQDEQLKQAHAALARLQKAIEEHTDKMVYLDHDVSG